MTDTEYHNDDERRELILDGTKVAWHQERIKAWERGERIAPITIDMSLTRACNYACHFCYAMLQENERQVINQKVMYDFLEDCADIALRPLAWYQMVKVPYPQFLLIQWCEVMS